MAEPPTAVLHIGLEKTGTTYLQTLLHDNAAELERRGIGYPRFLGNANHHALAAYARDADPGQDIHRWHDAVGREHQERFRAELGTRLRAAVAASSSRRWVFSSEHLSSRLDTDDAVRRCTGLFETVGLTPRVLVFLRPQEAMIESTFTTAVLNGSTAAFDVEAAVAEAARYDFAALLGRWERTVGIANLTALAYPDDGGTTALVNVFCSAAGLEAQGLSLPRARVNPRMSYAQAELLRLLNAAVGPVPRRRLRRNGLHDRLRDIPGPPFALLPEERERVREAFAESNRLVAERYGVDLTPRPARGTTRAEDFTREDVAAFLGALGESMPGDRRLNAPEARARPGSRRGSA